MSIGWRRHVDVRAAVEKAASGAISSVADMTTIRRSPRAFHACFASASPTSAYTLRSWNSSTTIVVKPLSSGSCWSRAVRIPSVASSTRVSAPNRRSNRTCHPTSRPSVHPCSSAIRRAIARAATRRGCSTITGPSAASAGGTLVVLPAPGAALRITARCLRTSLSTWGTYGSIGRSVIGGESPG